MTKEKVVILGAGVTGLVSALELSDNYDVVVIEKSKNVGGMSTSFLYKDFILDYGPHKIYTQIPGIIDNIREICPLLKIKKKNSIYLKNYFFNFPLSIIQVGEKMPFTAFSGFLDIIKNKLGKKSGSYLENRFGKTLYELVFKNYAEKLWGNPKELDIELAKRRVSMSSFFDLVKSMLFKDSKKISADYFYYPIKGSYQLYDNIADEIKKNRGKILTNCKVKEIKIERNNVKEIKLNSNKIKIDFLVSTIPLIELTKLIKPIPPREIIEAASSLEYKDLNIIYFILKKKKAMKDNWIFFPGKKFLFNRISEQKSFSPFTCPKDKTALMIETTLNVDDKIIEKIKKQLINLKIFNENEVEEVFVKKLEKAYPLYKRGFKKHLNLVLSYLDKIENLLTIGRHGLFNYNNIDQCWDMALKAAKHIEENRNKEDWKKIRKIFDSYKIVD